MATVMLAQIMDLGMTVVTWRDGILSPGSLDLLGFQPAIFPTGIWESRLQEATATAATVVVGFVGCHVDEVFFADNLFDHIAQIIGHRVAKRLSDQLAGILNGEGDLQVLVPVGAYRQSSFPDPSRVILNNAGNLEVVRNVEFFQSGPDCEEFVSSFRVEPHLTAQVVHSFGLDPDNMLPTLVVGEKEAVVFRCPSFGTVCPVGSHLV